MDDNIKETIDKTYEFQCKTKDFIYHARVIFTNNEFQECWISSRGNLDIHVLGIYDIEAIIQIGNKILELQNKVEAEK